MEVTFCVILKPICETGPRLNLLILLEYYLFCIWSLASWFYWVNGFNNFSFVFGIFLFSGFFFPFNQLVWNEKLEEYIKKRSKEFRHLLISSWTSFTTFLFILLFLCLRLIDSWELFYILFSSCTWRCKGFEHKHTSIFFRTKMDVSLVFPWFVLVKNYKPS